MNNLRTFRANPLRNHAESRAIVVDPEDQSQTILPELLPDFIYGMHEPGGERLMTEAGRKGWVLHLAAIGLEGTSGKPDYTKWMKQGFGVVVRLNNGYGDVGTLPEPSKYPQFAKAAATYVERSRGCNMWIVGNEPNHEQERPYGQPIYPVQYASAYRQVRKAIRSVPGHERDVVLVAGSAPWNASTTYAGNERGDWVRYFIDVMQALNGDKVDGFSIHTYTHDLNPQQISGDFFHEQPGYEHLRNEFRTYIDYMSAIPDRFRHLPVIITETDPTTRHQGWNPGANVGWVQAAYQEIAEWNANSQHQPIQGLILYRWPVVPDQPEWSISDRPGIIEDFSMALRAKPETAFKVREPNPLDSLTVIAPGNLLPEDQQWPGTVAATLGLLLRTGPSTQHEVIQVLPYTSLVTVLAEVGEWLFVNALDHIGYVNREFVLRQVEKILNPPESGYLRERSELMRSTLAPPDDERIWVDPNNSTWTDKVIADTWNQYGALIRKVSEMLMLNPAIAVAVMSVESGGRAFMDDGRMRIRFENHIFFRQYGRLDPEKFSKYLKFDLEREWEGHFWRPSADAEWQTFHGDHQAEWHVFNLARTKFDPHNAKLSISMGLPQIMGFNYHYAGYDSVEEMFVNFRDSANAQILGFFDFIRSKPEQLTALQNGDFFAFATSYNGGGQADLYADLMEDGVLAYTRLRSNPDASLYKSSGPTPRLPYPPDGSTLISTDPELYAAWRDHIIQGFSNNQEMFDRILKSFMDPYNSTVRMYRMMFYVGLVSFAAGIILSFITQQVMFAFAFGGLTAASFVTFFLSRPLRSLEENLNFITWLGVIYNSYWARLVYALNTETIQSDLKEITEDFVQQIERLVERNNTMREDSGSENPGRPD